MATTVDVGATIDTGRWTGDQKLLVAGTALTIVLDGLDSQLLPNAVPFMAPEWGVPNSAFRNGGSSGYFMSWAVLMVCVFLCLAVVRRHVPPATPAASR